MVLRMRQRQPDERTESARLLGSLHRALIHGGGGAGLDLTGANVALDFSGRAIADAKAIISDSLAPFDAIQTLGAIVVFSVFSPAETYSEPTSVPSGRVEYVASTLLERNDPGGLRVMTVEQTDRAAGAIQRALDAADEIARNTIFAILSKTEPASDPLKRIAGHLQLMDAGVRGPGYESQAKDLIEELFADAGLEFALRRTLGFTAAEALALETALSGATQERMNETLRTIELITNNRHEMALELQRRGEHILSFTPQEISDLTGVGVDVASAFLHKFSVGFGERERAHLLTGLSAIRRRPLVRAADGRYLSTSPLNLLWVLQPAFESALKDEPEWETFQQRRAAFVETKVVDRLADAVRADMRFVNLQFSIAGGRLYEIDGVVIVDDVAFVLEAKAGRLTDQARRGRVRELRSEIERLVERGASQAARLRSAILEGADVAFFDGRGAAVDVTLGPVERVEACVVTLEDFSWLVGSRQDLVAANLIDAGEPVPWIVSVFDFELVCLLLEFPAQLTLYLKDRRELPENLTPGDELNLWMIHLLRKLEFPADAGRISLRGDWTDEVDRYFMFRHGELPTMPLSRRTRALVERVDRERKAGHVRAIEQLIARDQATRVPRAAVVMRRGDVTVSMFARNA
jgi:hypothetical protein